MTRHYRRYDDDPTVREPRSSGAGLGTLLLVAALGAGIGLLAAPETGVKTRRRLRRRLAHIGSDLGEGVQEFGGRARERMRSQLAALRSREAELEDEADEEEEEEDEQAGGALGTILAAAVGAAASYFLSSERAAPARTRVRETADTVRRRATDRWQQFQRSRGNGVSEETGSETAGSPHPSDEPPLGS